MTLFPCDQASNIISRINLKICLRFFFIAIKSVNLFSHLIFFVSFTDLFSKIFFLSNFGDKFFCAVSESTIIVFSQVVCLLSRHYCYFCLRSFNEREFYLKFVNL